MPEQLTAEDMKAMTPHQIVEAKAAGQLDRLLGVPEATIERNARARAGQATAADLAELRRERRADLVAAHLEAQKETTE